MPDLCRLLQIHCQQSYLLLDTNVSLPSSHCECVQGRVDSLLGFKRKYQFSLNSGDMTDVDWLPSQYPLFLHFHLCTWHLAFPAKLKLLLLHGKQRGGSFLCALLILSLNSFAGSVSKEGFYILIFLFSNQVWLFFSHSSCCLVLSPQQEYF